MGRCLSKMCSKCRCRILGYFLIRVADHWGNTELLWTLILHTLITRAYAHWLKRGGAKFKNHSCPPIRAIWIFVIVFVLKEVLSERIFYDYRLPIPARRNSPFWFHPCGQRPSCSCSWDLLLQFCSLNSLQFKQSINPLYNKTVQFALFLYVFY